MFLLLLLVQLPTTGAVADLLLHCLTLLWSAVDHHRLLLLLLVVVLLPLHQTPAVSVLTSCQSPAGLGGDTCRRQMATPGSSSTRVVRQTVAQAANQA
jgi:hypothetical protein